MLIGNDYKVETDSSQYILYERKTVSEWNGVGRQPKAENIGKEHWKVIGYFGLYQTGFRCLVDKIAHLNLAETQMRDFNEIAKKQEEIYQLIQTLQCP